MAIVRDLSTGHTFEIQPSIGLSNPAMQLVPGALAGSLQGTLPGSLVAQQWGLNPYLSSNFHPLQTNIHTAATLANTAALLAQNAAYINQSPIHPLQQLEQLRSLQSQQRFVATPYGIQPVVQF